MTDKKENILQAALQLFAKDGYNATSTSKVAKLAGVSEGLIFRHFENKEGLLKAIIQIGEEQIKRLFSDIVMETNPKEVILKTIRMPFEVKPEDYEFWRLQFKLKWELESYKSQKMEPLEMALSNAFSKLKYKNPELEAQFLLHLIDGLSTAILKNAVQDKASLLEFLLVKYAK